MSNGNFRLTHRLSLVTGLLSLALALPALSDATADHYRQTHATADGIKTPGLNVFRHPMGYDNSFGVEKRMGNF